MVAPASLEKEKLYAPQDTKAVPSNNNNNNNNTLMLLTWTICEYIIASFSGEEWCKK